MSLGTSRLLARPFGGPDTTYVARADGEVLLSYAEASGSRRRATANRNRVIADPGQGATVSASLGCCTMTDVSTAASLATAAGTLVLAAATFASIRSANRSARVSEFAARTAERSLLAAQRPLLVNSRFQDLPQKVQFYEGKLLDVEGGGATLEVGDDVVYMSASVRNVGTGLAVLLGWTVSVGRQPELVHPPLEDFTEQIRDIYIAPGDMGLWQGALRDPQAEMFRSVVEAITESELFMLYLLYGDFEGGQLVITMFSVRKANDKWGLSAGRHFNVDLPDPRHPE
jgi:hypothetical protein